MSLRDQNALRVVLYEGAGTEALEAGERCALVQYFLEKGFSITRSADRGAVAPADGAPLMVLGRFNDTAVLSAEDANGHVPLFFQDLNGLSVEQVFGAAEKVREQTAAFQPGAWKPWFPVIDYDRCTNCMQCLSFCLFGVYGVSEDHKIEVQHNDNCKTNCPACSRVCPEAAIMFPKYKAGPINGEPVTEADLQREKMKVDISALLGGDVYEMLRDRSAKAKSRFSKERDSDKALKERQKCLTKLQQMGDIPAEVLMSLPSPDEILRRAEEAKRKAAEALKP